MTATATATGLDLKPVPALIGGAVGAVSFLLPSIFVVDLGVLILLGIYTAIVLVAYVIGSLTVGDSAGEFCRGLLIGATAAMNLGLASLVYGKLFGSPGGTILAVIVGAYAFLSIIPVVSRNAFYSGLLGYLNWLLPMSWLIVGLGFAFFLLGLLGALIGLTGATFFQLQGIVFHWQTGTLFTRGGWISNANPIDTAFNMGNFAFADVNYGGMAEDHESGHTLNLAAFGSVFHLIGALDENVIRNGANALSERLAESHVPGTASPALAMWG